MTSSPEIPAPCLLPDLSRAVPARRRRAVAPSGRPAAGALELPELGACRVAARLARLAPRPRPRPTRRYERGLRGGTRARARPASEQRVRVGARDARARGRSAARRPARELRARPRARPPRRSPSRSPRKLVQREVTADPALVRELVRPRARDGAARRPARGAAAPGRPRRAAERLAGGADGTGGQAAAIQWVGGPGASSAAAFVLESPQRIVDGRLDVALRSLYERLEHE